MTNCSTQGSIYFKDSIDTKITRQNIEINDSVVTLTSGQGKVFWRRKIDQMSTSRFSFQIKKSSTFDFDFGIGTVEHILNAGVESFKYGSSFWVMCFRSRMIITPDNEERQNQLQFKEGDVLDLEICNDGLVTFFHNSKPYVSFHDPRVLSQESYIYAKLNTRGDKIKILKGNQKADDIL